MSNCKPLKAYLCPQPSGPVRAMKEGETFGLTDAERGLFDCVINEHVGIIGTQLQYFQNLQEGVVDPLYNEPAKRKYNGPFLVMGFLSYPDHAPNVGMEGFRSYIDSTAYITRAAFEKAGVNWGPSESDIIRAWPVPYWNQSSVDGFAMTGGPNLNGLIPGAGLYFSITDVREEGVLFDTPSFVGFQLTLRRITEQTPERKLTNSL